MHLVWQQPNRVLDAELFEGPAVGLRQRLQPLRAAISPLLPFARVLQSGQRITAIRTLGAVLLETTGVAFEFGWCQVDRLGMQAGGIEHAALEPARHASGLGLAATERVAGDLGVRNSAA